MSASALPAELDARVRAWIAEDPDEATRDELQALLAAGDEAALRERFDHPLDFGTAGLRGPLGGGPGRMNRAVVRRTSAGLARFVRQQGELAAEAGVVVGHDARHGSALFADDTARVLAAAGVRAHAFSSALATPITAFAVRALGAAAGVMVTASHNPAPDNGYKVYAADGAQVIPPEDGAIAAAAAERPVPSDDELAGDLGDRLAEIDERALLAAYRRRMLALLDPRTPRSLAVVYTPIHGVGRAVLPALLEAAGFAPPALVAAQADPDPDFPTAPFPNPEEPGVLDLALAQAEAEGADLVLANDPDADRLAVAVPAPAPAASTARWQALSGGRWWAPSGERWRVLTGDQLGVLLADHLIAASAGASAATNASTGSGDAGTGGEGRLVATTVVSSSMLRALAAARGVAYVETLTGFKWVARAATRRPGHRLLFGYEEALGYAVTDAVADKDGLSAALVVAELAAVAKAEGRSLLDRLDALESELGVHATAQWSLRLEGADAPDRLATLVGQWRKAPPERLAGLEVTEVRDLAQGDGELPPSNVLVLRLAASGRVVLRPSGTEPKLKAYLEATTPPPGPEGLAEARAEAGARLGELRRAVAERFGQR